MPQIINPVNSPVKKATKPDKTVPPGSHTGDPDAETKPRTKPKTFPKQGHEKRPYRDLPTADKEDILRREREAMRRSGEYLEPHPIDYPVGSREREALERSWWDEYRQGHQERGGEDPGPYRNREERIRDALRGNSITEGIRSLGDIMNADSLRPREDNMPNTYRWGRRAIDWYGVPDEEGISGGAGGPELLPSPEAVKEALRQSEHEPGPWDYHPNMSALHANPGSPAGWEDREPGLGRGPDESLWDLYQRKLREGGWRGELSPAPDPAGQSDGRGMFDFGGGLGSDINQFNPIHWADVGWDNLQASGARPVDTSQGAQAGAAGVFMSSLLDMLPYILAGA